MRRGAPRGATLALSSLKAAALGLLLAVGISLSLQEGAAPAARPTSTADAYTRLVDRAGLQCSPDRAGDTGSTAVVRRPDGSLEFVPFSRGWDVYTGKRPGTLVAVCISRPGTAVTSARSSR